MGTETVYIVTDLGVGDGGKGGVVHKIATMLNAHTVIKRGGAQGSHGMANSQGEGTHFSQWGCGTFEGIPTHLTDQMIVAPEGLLNEGNRLIYEHGVHDAYDLLTVDEGALCATHFHGLASRIKELARGNNPRGTVGTGVGEAYRYLKSHPELAIFARDLSRPESELRQRLAAVRARLKGDLDPALHGRYVGVLPEDRGQLLYEFNLLTDNDYFDFVVQRFVEAGKRVRVVGHEYLAEEVLTQDGVAVVETSHGVLSDRVVGFHPHTSAIRTLPSFTQSIFEEAGYTGEIAHIGIHRAYSIRHGAGPMPTADPAMAERLLPGSHKAENRWQGKIRVGPLDLVLLKYAISACGGPTAFNALGVTWFDQVQRNGAWEVCRRYDDASDPEFFSPEGEILVCDPPSQEHQAALTQKLFTSQPQVSTIDLDPNASREDLFRVCAGVFEDAVNVPVRMVSFGKTELDKLTI